MEEEPEYYADITSKFPSELKQYVNFHLSPKIDDYHCMFRGVRYRDVPRDRKYDFVFVDGPKITSPTDGQQTFDFDLLHVIKNSDTPVTGYTDSRFITVWVLSKVLTRGVRFDYAREMGIIGPCTKNDVRFKGRSIMRNLGPHAV